MRKEISAYGFILSLLVLLTGCVERVGYYSDDEENLISLICDINWATEVTTDEDGTTWQAVYQFKRDATCRRTLIQTSPDGEVKTSYITELWSFTDQSYSCISFTSGHYWDMDILTAEKFAFYDRSGEWNNPYMKREYTVLTPYNGTDL